MFPIQEFGDYLSQTSAHRRATVKLQKDNNLTVMRAALQCALQLREDAESILGSKVLIGIGYGQAGLLHVGGVFNRAGYFPYGEGLSSALRCLRHANEDNQLVVGPEVHEACHRFFNAELLDNPSRSLWVIKELKGEVLKQSAAANIWRNSLSDEILLKIAPFLKPYIPASFRPYLKITKDRQGNENRRVSILAVNIRMENFVSQNGSDPYSHLQEIVRSFQQQIYRMEGSFDKIIAHDGGLVIVGIFGLGGLAHQDDAQRACLAAFNFQEIFEKIKEKQMLKINLYIAITTGFITIGIAGNEGSRKEIATLGDPVDRAYLILQVTTEKKLSILADFNTKVEASSGIKFEYDEHINFSHKKLNLPFFVPKNPLTQWWKTEDLNYADLDPFLCLKIQSNPFLPDILDQYQSHYCKPNLAEGLLDSLFEMTKMYIEQEIEEKPYIFLIRGQPGSGKSVMLRRLTTYFLKDQRRKEINNLGYAFEMCFTSSNAEIQKHFLGIWIPILRHMLSRWSQMSNIKPAMIINEFIQKFESISDKVYLIEELFGIKDLIKATQQKKKDLTDLDFVKNEEFTAEVEEDLVNFCMFFMCEAIEFQKQEKNLIFFLMIDNASRMDRCSWQLFLAIAISCPTLIIYCCFQSLDNFLVQKDKDQELNAKELKKNQLLLKVTPQAQDFYNKQVVPKQEDLFNVFELDSIDENQLRQILSEQLGQYQLEMQAEINAEIEYQERDHLNQSSQSIKKTPESSNKMLRYLMRKSLVYEDIYDVDSAVIEVVIRKSQGNPLYALEFLKQMMDVSFQSYLE